MAKIKKPKEKMSSIDKYLIFVFTSVVLYTIATLFIFYRTMMEPTTLTVSFFGLFGGEITLLALIKRLKLKKEDKEDEENSKKTKDEIKVAASQAVETAKGIVEPVKNMMSGDDDALG